MSRRATLDEPRSEPAPGGPDPSGPRRRVRLAGYAAGFAIVAVVVVLGAGVASWLHRDAEPAGTGETPIVLGRPILSEAGLAERTGIRVTTVAVTGGGGLLDLRFQVIDPDKAAEVHDPESPPTIVEESSGLIVNQLLMGHLHSGTYKAGVSYYLIFENPGNLVRRGSLVTIMLGDAQIQHLVVQ